MIDIDDTILNQYSSCDRILGVIQTLNQAVSLDEFTDEFLTEVWDLTTCGTYGLDVWGKIVGAPRYLLVEASEVETLGFNEALGASDAYPQTFGNGVFYPGEQKTNLFYLADYVYRTIILCKALKNISICTYSEINYFLSIIFRHRGRAYCSKRDNMVLGINTNFPMEPYEKAIFQDFRLLPVPCGVDVTFVRDDFKFFGFTQSDYPFTEGVFYSGGGFF